ncbi:GGDEF domain-containing protein [Secundilactobacillus similis]|uniref:Signal transduction diguanylate cyclase n=1 Tax=Secundilactobacillus similis DSM 23365 = JCM 2765 TaxID=1423804 RepID=A0A0R2FDI5_9LACO|nr:GGDEF domain-containing protein [Secundilactobacillus similis]KRN26591.1 Signal transduction diguanylate cyclase [Secundilactobacillus similis DSM 23365 = JCM 2765]
MELFGNTFFWSFFFMIGFVATLELIEDLGNQVTIRLFHRKIETVWLLVAYVVVVILFVRVLRLFGTTYTWTANALRNGALIYMSLKLHSHKGYAVLLGCVFLSFWPYWDWNMGALAGFVGTLVLLYALNYWQNWIRRNQLRLFATLCVTSLIIWLFDMYSYGYELGQTLSVTVCFIAVMVLAYLYDQLLAYRKRREQELTYDTQHDALTGVHSRIKFNNDFSRYRQLVNDGKIPVVHLVMVDIDHFKRVNDTYGHLAGDAVLKAFAQDFTDYLDTMTFPATLYRTGGEEFSVILNGGTSNEQASVMLANYRKHLANLKINAAGASIKLTISAGVTQIAAADHENDQVISRADANLYAAKRAGRDRVVSD